MKSALLVACLLGLTLSPRASAVEAEILHWWTEPGARSAVNVLADAFRAANGTWTDVGRLSYAAARKQALERLSHGYAPTAMQWNAGIEVNELAALSMIGTLSPTGVTQSWPNRLYDFVNKAIVHQERVIAIPLNIHGENWLWINKHIYDALDLKPPDSWETLIAQAKLIADAGYLPLAIGTEGYQLQVLFNNIVLGIGGRSLYSDLYLRRELSPTSREQMREVFRIFLALRNFQRATQQSQTWYDATRSVLADRAALQFMGDWAKAEFEASGWLPGSDFYCQLSPGSEQTYLYVIDVFVVKRDTINDSGEARETLAAALTDTTTQLAFSQKKGSIPVVRDLPTDVLDVCAQKAVELVRDESRAIPSMALVADLAFTQRVYQALLSAWQTPSMSPHEGVATLRKTLRE